jgi:hypothetical protein
MSQPQFGSEAVGAQPTVGKPSGPGGRPPSWRLGVIDVCLAAVIGLSALLVHDVPYMLHHPFWLDEAWVADTIRAPLGLTRSLASSTPLGWTVLLRLVPFGGPQRLRLVPLAFTMLAAATAYLFGHELRLTRYTTGILTGAAVLLSPALLVRDDLKQYTAEAFACVLLWLLVARVENEWRLRRVVAIAATTCVGLLFANTVIFVGVAAMGSLAIECLATRHWRRLIGIAGASAGMLAVSLVIYEVLIRSQVTPTLTAYWAAFYVPRSASAFSFIASQLDHLAPYLGFRYLVIDLVLALAGIAALIWLRRFALAAMLPVILTIVIVASAADKYPFGDLRTSTFWLVTVPLLMAVAVAAASRRTAAIARWAPAAVTAAALIVWVLVTSPAIRSHPLPNENVRSQVAYLDAHFRRGDVVIVSYAASYAFAYYYHGVDPSFRPDPVTANGHVPAYPGVPWIVTMTNRRAVDVANALATAEARIATEHGGTRGRIWIVRSHLQPTEIRAWQRDLAEGRTTTIHAGREPILLYIPPARPVPG